jgi:hypothetical protein
MRRVLEYKESARGPQSTPRGRRSAARAFGSQHRGDLVAVRLGVQAFVAPLEFWPRACARQSRRASAPRPRATSARSSEQRSKRLGARAPKWTVGGTMGTAVGAAARCTHVGTADGTARGTDVGAVVGKQSERLGLRALEWTVGGTIGTAVGAAIGAVVGAPSSSRRRLRVVTVYAQARTGGSASISSR